MGWTGSLRLIDAFYCLWNGLTMRSCCVALGTISSYLWWSMIMWEKRMYTCMCNSVYPVFFLPCCTVGKKNNVLGKLKKKRKKKRSIINCFPKYLYNSIFPKTGRESSSSFTTSLMLVIACLFFFFVFFLATPTTQGGSQASSQIRAVAVDLRHRHSDEPCLWPTPQLTAMPDP